MAENAEEVMYTPGWADLDQNILILIVQRDDLQVRIVHDYVDWHQLAKTWHPLAKT